MSETVENQSSSALDTFKWLIVFALLAGLVAGNHYFEQASVLYRALAAVAVVVVAGFIAATTMKGTRFWRLPKIHVLKCAKWFGHRVKKQRRRP